MISVVMDPVSVRNVLEGIKQAAAKRASAARGGVVARRPIGAEGLPSRSSSTGILDGCWPSKCSHAIQHVASDRRLWFL